MDPEPKPRATKELILLIVASATIIVTLTAVLVSVLGFDQVEQLLGAGGVLVTALTGTLSAEIRWWRARHTRPEASTDPTSGIINDLAANVGKQWVSHAQRKDDEHSKPLDVRWAATERDIQARWKDVFPDGDLTVAADFHGDLDDIGEKFSQLPYRRLVIIGLPGSGKTFLANELMRQLLSMRNSDPEIPVPIVVPVSSWEPSGDSPEHAREWIAEYIAVRHPALRAKVPSAVEGEGKISLAMELLRSGKIMPILDGLDEMRPEKRRRAIKSLNRLMVDGGGSSPMVLTSRADEFENAVLARDKKTEAIIGAAVLSRAAVVELHPVSAPAVADYLEGTTNIAGATAWKPVIDEILKNPDSPLALVLSTPFMVWLARTIFDIDDYAELTVTPADLKSAADPQTLLLDTLIPTVYSRRHSKSRKASRWTPDQAERWLTFLASHLYNLDSNQQQKPENTNQSARGSHDLEWWNLTKAGRVVVGVMSGIFAGLVTGVATGFGFAFVFDQNVGLIAGLVLGALIGIPSAFTAPPPTELEVRIQGRGGPALTAAILVGVIAGIGGAIAENSLFGVMLGLLLGSIIGIAYGLTAKTDIKHAPSPDSTLARDRNVIIAYATMYGFPIGLAAGLVRGPWTGLTVGLACALSGGFVYGPVWALAFRYNRVGLMAWFRFSVARLWLAFRRRLPLSLMAFLRDAHDREVLRQVGAVYQFRHAILRDRLATRAEAGDRMAEALRPAGELSAQT